MRVQDRRVVSSWLVVAALVATGCGPANGFEETESGTDLPPIFPEVDDLSFGAERDSRDSLCFYAAAPSWGLEMDERCFEAPHIQMLELVGVQAVIESDGSEATASLLASAFDIEVQAVEQLGVPVPWQQRDGALLALAGLVSAETPIVVTFFDGQTVTECRFSPSPEEFCGVPG